MTDPTLAATLGKMDLEGVALWESMVGPKILEPDLIIAPQDQPYLYRWYISPHNQRLGNVYFHLQVGSDPERPLHDHPWDNFSNILRGGYLEYIQKDPPNGFPMVANRRPGDVVFRRAQEAHRLELPEGVPYTMTLFSTGPKVRQWGFWYPSGWVDCLRAAQLRGDPTENAC